MKERPSTAPNADGSAPDEAITEGSPDVVFVHGVEPSGQGLKVLRYRDRQLEVGAVRPLREGQPIQGELVRLHPRRELPLVCDVEVELPAPHASPRPAAASEQTKGPAQVATDRYRDNWDRIWRKKRSLPN